MTASDYKALASAQSIKVSQKKGRRNALLTLIFGIAISIVFLPAAIIAIIGLIIIYKIYCSECHPHQQVLLQFAEANNWYYAPQTELQSVEWQTKRVRFYSMPSLLSVDCIIARLISGDFVPRKPPPRGEVPRKQRQTHLTTLSDDSESKQIDSHDTDDLPAATQPHIPPAGWNPNRVVTLPNSSHAPAPAVARLPSNEEQQLPFDKPDITLRRRIARTSKEVAKQGIADISPAPEGLRKPKTNYVKVRSAKLRKAAIQIHGRNCIVCGKNFDEMYGPELAKGYIEVHHLNSIAKGERTTDPATDLVPLCSNCHKMADRLSPPPRTIHELKNRLIPESRIDQTEIKFPTESSKRPVIVRSSRSSKKKPKAS